VKRGILFLVLAAFITAMAAPALWSEDPVPWDPDEFPKPLRDLRRGEIIFFGSIPITFLLSGLGWELGQAAAGDEYLYSDEQHTYNILLTAGALSLTIALLDYFLGLLDS
jgi:hypothetical protein